ncbi:MAG: recombinase family protein [Eubacteriales bacterium]
MKFFIYSRKSVYTARGDSVENQVQLCRQYIEARYPNPEEVRVYEDEGFSGKNLNRPQFQQMHQDFQRCKPDFLVCYRLDRISRSIGDFATLFEDLNKRGISFLCIKENFDTSTPMGKAMLYITSVFAQLERETIAERVRDNMMQLARTGRWLGGTAPLGFIGESVVELDEDGRKKQQCQLKIIPDEMETVMAIFTCYEQKHSISAVHKLLFSQHIKGRNGGNFSLLGIKEILQNPAYCQADGAARDYFQQARAQVCFEEVESGRGLMVYNKRDYQSPGGVRQPIERWIVASGRHPGVIPGEQWVKIQHLLNENRPNNEKPSKVHNNFAVLTGVIRCGWCGAPMYAKKRANGNGFDYVCRKKLIGGRKGCAVPNIQGMDCDRRVLTKILGIEGAELPVADLQSLVKEVQSQDGGQTEAKLNKYRGEIENLVRSMGESVPSRQLVARVDQRILQLEEKIELLDKQCISQGKTDKTEAEMEKMIAYLSSFTGLFMDESNVIQRDFVRQVTSSAIWDGENLRITLHP